MFNPVALQPANQFFHPCYQIPENMYCVPQPANAAARNLQSSFATIPAQNISY